MKNIPYGHQKIESDDIKEVAAVLMSDWLTQGPKVREFEDALSRYAGAKYAVAVSSGTAALHVACLAAGIKKGDEVITSPLTFVASANCVLYCGGKPVFADVRNDTVNIDPQEIEKRINRKTKAIIPVHFAGHPADMEEIHSIAQRHKLLVIEDAAHALGAEYSIKNKGLRIKRAKNDAGDKWIKIGSCRHSDMAVFSFHPVKSITTGEGGAVLTNRKDLYEKLLMFRNHGITKDTNRFTVYGLRFTGPWYYEQQYLGFNYRITDFQCALGISQLKKLDGFIKRRRTIAFIYNKGLAEIDEVKLPVEREYVKSAYHLYYIRLRKRRDIEAKRKDVFDRLRRRGVGVHVHYIPVHLQPYYREHFDYGEGDYPIAEDYYKRALTIPIYPAMRNKDIKYVVRTLKEILT